MSITDTIDRTGLETTLKRNIMGEVRFDSGFRALYTSDASNYRQVPIGVVTPQNENDVIAIIATAREFGAPILSRGGGTSISGQCCNEAIVMDFSKYMNMVIEIDAEKKLARVQPGTVLDDLRDQAKQFGLTFGPDPATHRWCTLGGMIGNNSCGVHSIMAGRTVDNVHSLKVLRYDGTILTVGKGEIVSGKDGVHLAIEEKLRGIASNYADEIRRTFPNIPRRVSGYSIDQLLPENGFHIARSLVGSEGTLVTILEATVHLIPNPNERVLLVLGFDDLFIGGDNVPVVLEHKPIGLEGFDDRFLQAVRTKGLQGRAFPEFPNGKGWLMAEFGGATVEEARHAAEECARALKPLVSGSELYVGDAQKAIWAVRDSALGAISRVPGQPDNWEGWEDAAVSTTNIGSYLRDFQKLLAEHGYSAAMYGHIGDGCMHNRINWDPKSKEGIEKWVKFTNDAADLVLSYGGSISGEHGDGQARGALLPKMFGPKIMQAFEEFKTIWDPDWKMNPGKLIRPYRIDENLRYGANYNPPILPTIFQFPEDNGSFARATERCVGAGVCRRDDTGVMCPSYRATREEEQVTRGRTHLLWEMLNGDVITESWKSNEVKDALDLCLACKGCKTECPVRVDMATYKSEFLSHYYEGKARPRTAYTMGMIHKAARIASKMPAVVNFFTHAPIMSSIAKSIAGIHPKRTIPTFANETFKSWFKKRRKSDDAKQKQVILWADTFNNYFRTETAKAAVKVLEAAGFQVKVYKQNLCCGRPLYDWGMLKEAKNLLEEILTVVDKDVSDGIPIVVLEPSCASVFKDELHNLMPERENAKRLGEHVYLLSDFLEKFAPNFIPSHLQARGKGKGVSEPKAIVQLHCHHQTVLGKSGEESILKKIGIEHEILDAGCCGMAGAFGFEKDKFDVSTKIGERKLFPKIRQEGKGRVVIANGFSCREQLEQSLEVSTSHLAEILAERLSD